MAETIAQEDRPNIELKSPAKQIVAFTGPFIFCAITILGTYGARVATPKIVAMFNAQSYYVLLTVIASITAALGTPIGGKLGDIFGRKKALCTCLAVSTVGSILMFFCRSWWPYFFARAILGFIGGLEMGMMMGVTADVTTKAERPFYFAFQGTFAAVAIMLGSTLGGAICDYLSPLYIHLFSAPLSLLCLLSLLIFYKNKPGVKAKIDWMGILFLAVFLGFTLCTISLANNLFRWSDPIAWVLLAVGFAGLVLLLWWEKNKAASPIIPLSVFQIRTYRTIVIFVCLLLPYNALVTTYLPALMQYGQGFSATAAGFVSLPKGVIAIVLPGIVSGWMIKSRRGTLLERAKKINLLSGVFLIAALVLIVLSWNSSMNYIMYIIALCIIGLGEMCYKVGASPFVNEDLPVALIGAGLAVNTFCQTLMNTVCPAVFGAVYNSMGGVDNVLASWPVMCYFALAVTAAGLIYGMIALKAKANHAKEQLAA